MVKNSGLRYPQAYRQNLVILRWWVDIDDLFVAANLTKYPSYLVDIIGDRIAAHLEH
ncbi:MAG: hypothetical protein ACKO7R_15485 [Pseudanabaena sp.]